jgi:bacillithiol biosynthesis cysteine-adding enzyme BshC
MIRIPLTETGLLPPVVQHYLQGAPALAPFTAFAAGDEGLKAALAQRRFPDANRRVLVDALQRQYERAGLALPDNAAALGQPDVLTITTGHQLCLFGGPAYFIYKIAHTVALAHHWSQASGRRVVPVFWMSTEDHDVDEIDHVRTPRGELKANWPRAVPAGRLGLEAVHPLIERLPEIFGHAAAANELQQLFRRTHKTGTLADATRRWVHALFGEQGLVIVDGDDAALKQLAFPVFEQELEHGTAAAAARSTTAALEALGCKPQAHVRDINLFWLEGNTRRRLVRVNGQLQTDDGQPLPAPQPVNLSPNVVLRPLYQELVLPNVAYVGGAGELSYWLQLKGVFDAFDVPMPALVLRNSHAFVDAKHIRQLSDLGLAWKDLFLPADRLETLWLSRQTNLDDPFADERRQVELLMDAIGVKQRAVDGNLARSVEALRHDLLKRLDQLQRQRVRALKRREREGLARLHAVREALLPGGVLGERKWSGLLDLAALNKSAGLAPLDGHPNLEIHLME